MIKGSTLLIISLIFVLSAAQTYNNYQYNHLTATEMSRASFASYCPYRKLDGLKCGKNCDSLKGYTFLRQAEFSLPLQSLSYSTFIKPESKRFVIAFRGTNNLVQLTNEIALSVGVSFNLCPNVRSAKALLYFYAGYTTKVRDDILAQVRNYVRLYPDYDFYFTGHSLGGALATLASLDMACNNILAKKKIHLFTFGSPRVGDINLANAVIHHIGEHWRITHNKDAVVHIPPCKMNAFGRCTPEGSRIVDAFLGAFNYGWHLWPEVHYSQGFSSYRVCETSEHDHCANQFTLPFTAIGDHKTYLGSEQGCN